MKPGAYLLSVLIMATGIGSAQAKDPVALIENMAAGIDGPKDLELLYPDQTIFRYFSDEFIHGPADCGFRSGLRGNYDAVSRIAEDRVRTKRYVFVPGYNCV